MCQKTLWNKYWKEGGKKIQLCILLSPCEDFISHLLPPFTSSYSVRLHLMRSHLISISSSLNIHALGLNRLCVTTWCKDVVWNSWASTCSESRYYFYSQIMKQVLYHLLLIKGEIGIVWLPLQLGSESNPCAQISGIETAFSPAPPEFSVKAAMIAHVTQARRSDFLWF